MGERVIDPATAQLLAEMLQTVVESGGTGTRAAVPGFGVAGKTGTARKILNGTYSDKHLVASFAGFCPVDNPRITVVVIIDEPKTMSYGGQSAAPTFSRISQQVLNYMNVAPRVQLTADAGFKQATEYTDLGLDRSG
jgi:cell division protein FtsI (penicillin-binding protein 3)